MNKFGNIFSITLWGESHSDELGVIIDGCPHGIPISDDEFDKDIQRRKTGNLYTSTRIENDKAEIRSGVYNGYTDGSPICIAFKNENTISKDYEFNGFYRPGHADFTANKKYNGYNNPLGGGLFSGRMTLPIVAAGVIAKKIAAPTDICAHIRPECVSAIEKAKTNNDSIGGIVECTIKNADIGLGEPFFDSIESLISHAMFSIPGAKAIEFGNGIASAQMTGSEYNDRIDDVCGHTITNNCGGINGGISNGNDIIFRVFFHPTPSISKPQNTLNFDTMQMENFEISGRHDICFALRTPVVVEAFAAIVIADTTLISNKYKNHGYGK